MPIDHDAVHVDGILKNPRPVESEQVEPSRKEVVSRKKRKGDDEKQIVSPPGFEISGRLVSHEANKRSKQKKTY